MGYRIVLAFDGPEEALEALLYVGGSDAPVFLGDEATESPEDYPRVEVGDVEYPLWSGFDEAVAALRVQEPIESSPS